MKKRPVVLIAIACMVSLILLRCANPNGGNGSGVGNARISAMLYTEGGTPAVNAKVCFFRHDNDPRPGHGTGAVDSTTTDANGNYTARLDTGTYSILSSLGDKGTYQDSIRVFNDSTVHPPADTVRPRGSIGGKIELQGTDDPRTVFILFMGSNTFTMVNDTQGNFKATGMAKGKYRVRILTTLDNYRVMDTAFVVTAGVDSVMQEPILLEYTGIPTPEKVNIMYDSMKQIVTVRWSRADTAVVKSFNVYRRNVDSNTVLARINTNPIIDTLYRDSTGVQDQTYEYRVSEIDRDATEGVKSAGVSVKVVSALKFISFFGSAGINNGQFEGPGEMSFDSQGNIYVLDPFNTSGKIHKFDPNGNSLLTWVAGGATDELRDIEIVHDTLLVLERKHKSIKKYNTVGDSLNAWSYSSGGDPINFTTKAGYCFIVESTTNMILKFSLHGDSIAGWSSAGSYNFKSLKSISTNASNPNLYVLDADSVGIIIDIQGNLVAQFQIDRKSVVAAYTQWQLLDNGNLMLPGASRQKIFLVDTTGKFSGQFGVLGSLPGQFDWPMAVSADPSGRILVSDVGNYRVQIFAKK
jgi:hypothetical protein